MGLKEEVIDLQKEVKAVKEQSLAMELLSDYKKANKRQFIIILIILCMWFITIGYLVYILNDIGVEETTTTTTVEQSDAGTNNYIGNDGVINNGTKDKES